MDGLGADHRRERILAESVDGEHVLLLGQKLMQLHVRQAGLGDDVVLEIEHALDVLQRHVEQRPDARGQRLQEPDVGNRGGQFDVAHALAANPAQRHLDAALLADYARYFMRLYLPQRHS